MASGGRSKGLDVSYYPLLNLPDISGWTTIYNFPPNNWELLSCSDQWVNATFIHKNQWVTKNLGKLTANSVKTFTVGDLCQLASSRSLIFFSLTKIPNYNHSSIVLPKLNNHRTFTPVWRATIGLNSGFTQTSYQGEINPFPDNGTLLTFAPFLQYGNNIKNYLIFLNLEHNATFRTGKLHIYDANKMIHRKTFVVQNNSANLIPLDDLDLLESDLPMIVCKDMAGIPLYLSRTIDGSFMSLEHSHPPASFVIHGKRIEFQRFIKNYWFSRISK